MHTPSSTSRRRFVASAVAGAALLDLRTAVAQVDSSGGDWLAMVKAQHRLVEKTLEEMLGSRDKTFLKRSGMQQALSYQLTAHSVAEENVLYPALARAGMMTESDRLYLDQGHAKVMNADLSLVSEKDESVWFDKVRSLQSAVLQHAKEDEEARFYPQLRQKLDSSANNLLSVAFKREFASVRPQRGLS